MTEKPWTRKPRESKKLYARFQRYLHSNRNLQEFAQKEGKSLTTIEHNSSRWNWTSRATAYDMEKEKELQEKIRKTYEDLNIQGLNHVMDFLANLKSLEDDVMKRFREHEITSGTALRYLKDFIDCYGRATELYHIQCRMPLQVVESKKQDSNKNVAIGVEDPSDTLEEITMLLENGSNKIEREN